jgi:hypothetical protein
MESKTIYICKYSKREYDTPEECLASEDRELELIAKDVIYKNFRSICPTKHSNDDRYNHHCVLCGELIYYYTKAYDGHRNEECDRIDKISGKVLFDGLYCYECHEKMYEAITQLIGSHVDELKL